MKTSQHKYLIHTQAIFLIGLAVLWVVRRLVSLKLVPVAASLVVIVIGLLALVRLVNLLKAPDKHYKKDFMHGETAPKRMFSPDPK
jgi:hypothetical protein